MSLLFDISPDDIPDAKRKGRQRPKAEEAAEAEPAFTPAFAPRTLVILGKIDDVHRCARPACGAMAHDIIDIVRDEWLLECVFCGQLRWVGAVLGILDAKEPSEFRFQDGRFAGKTLDEVSRDPVGEKYIRVTAEKSPAADVREACRKWLDRPAGRV